MKPQGNGQPSRFAVSMSLVVREQLKGIHREGIETGRGQSVVSAFRQIVARLQHDPLHFGEPLYHLPALQLLVCQGGIRPLVVDYAIHEERSLVFIRGFVLSSANP